MHIVYNATDKEKKPKKYILSKDKDAIRAFVEKWKIKNNAKLDKKRAKDESVSKIC